MNSIEHLSYLHYGLLVILAVAATAIVLWVLAVRKPALPAASASCPC